MSRVIFKRHTAVLLFINYKFFNTEIQISMKTHSIRSIFLCLLLQLNCIRLSQTKPILINSFNRHTQSPNVSLAESIKMDKVMKHLDQFECIAFANNGNRAAGTSGFNETLDYLTKYLSDNTNFKITKTFFNTRDHTLKYDPILQSSVNGVITNHTYSKDLSRAEFYRVRYSTSIDSPDFIPISFIPNSGCSEIDWMKANPPAANHIALVQRGKCSFIEQSIFATKFNVAALLLYNDGTSPDNMSPIAIHLDLYNTIPALSLSFELGEKLAQAARSASNNVAVRMTIALNNEEWFPVGNICADTPTGDPTQTIVVGSHSDSVRAGPGINDDGNFEIF